MFKRLTRSRILVFALCQLLALQSALGQQAGIQRGLKIVVIEGAGARNVVQQIPARPPTVQVQDANNRPVAGASVVFTAPQVGASGEFVNDSRTFGVITDQDGLAIAAGFHPNRTQGPYEIRVRAEFQGESATAVIPQTNIGEKRSYKKLLAIVGLVGGAAAAIAFRSGNGGPGNNTPTITFGGGAVGAPNQ